jgi:hypothetical protein
VELESDFVGQRYVMMLRSTGTRIGDRYSPYVTTQCDGYYHLSPDADVAALQVRSALDGDDGPPWLSIGFGLGLGAIVLAGSGLIAKQRLTKRNSEN